jgi:hypothetical protein
MLNKSIPNPNAAHVATQLVRQFHRTMLAQDALKFGNEFEALGDRMQALQDEVTWHPCGSPQAALFMLGVASSLADDLRYAGTHGKPVHEIESTYRAIDRLLDSLTAYIEHTSGVQREDYRLEFFRSRGPRPSWGMVAEEAA